MKILNPIGSKERFLEMFQGVNKINLNEGFEGSESPLELGLDALANGSLNIEQVNNQVSGDESIVEITGTNGGLNVTFKFKVHSSPTDQEGVNSVDSADLIFAKVNDEVIDDESSLAAINASRGEQLVDAVSEYVEFESDSVSDEMYEEAAKFIDRVPYKKGSEEIQTQAAYADEKPTNPEVRVKSPELQKFVSEIQDYVPDEESEEEMDPTALPPEYGDEVPSDDDGSIGVDPYDMVDTDDTESVPELAPDKAAIITQAYENLIQAGNMSPTMDDITRESNRLQGIGPAPKTRALPPGAEEFFEEDAAADTQKMFNSTVDNQLSQETKEKIIKMSGMAVRAFLGDRYAQTPPQRYAEMVKVVAVDYLSRHLRGMNEEEESYPKPMGKTFKPKNQMPKKPKKRQAVVKLSEEEEEIPMDKKAEKAARGDIFRDMQGQNSGVDFDDWKYPLNKDTRFDDIYEEGPETGQAPDFKDMPDDDLEQVMKDKEEVGDEIEGGLADDKTPFDFCPKQIAKGIEVEMEHTDNPLIAIEIVMDHLVEDPKYYGETDEDPDKMAQKNAEKDSEKKEEDNEDEEVTDELLGFKPHNVGDYANEELDLPASPEQEKQYWDKENYMQDQDDPLEGNSGIFTTDDGQTLEVGFGAEGPKMFGRPSFDFGTSAEPFRNFKAIMDTETYSKFINGEAVNVVALEGNVGVSGTIQMKKQNSLAEEEGFEEYQGEVGDRYRDGEGNDFTVRDKVKGGVTLQGQGGEKEIANQDIGFLKKLSEGEVIEMARQALNKRGLNESMTRKEAVQILIKHNIK